MINDWKKKTRKELKTGTVAIHATDSHRETVRFAELFFNENGVHFLNYCQELRGAACDRLVTALTQLEGLQEGSCLDGYATLALYGVDSSTGMAATLPHPAADSVTFDPSKHFFFNGMKFIALRHLVAEADYSTR